MLCRFKKLPFEKQISVSFSVACTVLLSVTLVLIFLFDLARQQDSLDNDICSTAAYIAAMPGVGRMLERGYPDEAVTDHLDRLSASFSELDVIAVYDRDLLRFYHTDRHQTGETLVTGEETDILNGAEPYITTGYGTQGSLRRAYHAVCAEDGNIVGFVTVSVFTSAIWQKNLALILLFGMILCAALLTAAVLSRELVSLLKSSLQGHHPTELLDLYRRQDHVLNAIDDGLIATDTQGRVLFSNATACALFARPAERLLGEQFTGLFPESGCLRAAQTGEATHGRSALVGDHPVLVSEIPLMEEGRVQGVLNILHDKTEMRRLSDELSGARYMLDTLRFFNHEFMNKLHIILGYLQTGQIQQATQFIVSTSLVSGQSIRETADCVRVSRLCALIIGKMMHASEYDIRLLVTQDSCCREEDLLLSVEDCATIIGNLTENAIEELRQSGKEIRQIELSLYCRPDCNIIICADTGRGVDPQLKDKIWEKGVSVKGTGRGTGLCLVKQLTEEYGGTVVLETEPGEGSVFTLTFTRDKEVFECIG